MTHGRAKRILMAWERYHKRHHMSGPVTISAITGYEEQMHQGHIKAFGRVAEVGRAAPNGIRNPWHFHIRREGT